MPQEVFAAGYPYFKKRARLFPTLIGVCLRRWSRPPKVYLLMSNKQSHGGLGDGGGGAVLIQQMHVPPQQLAVFARELNLSVFESDK